MQITIFTDASFDPELKIGAWACWIKWDTVTVYSGTIPGICHNSTEAERAGVANALMLMDKMVNLKKYKIIIYCDNLAAMRPVKLSTKTGQKKQRGKSQLKYYQSNIEPYLNKCLAYDIRHVKSHLNIDKETNILNNWCDTEAKRLLVEYKSTIALSE